ncbi:glycosyltransferase [Phormidium tenue FACHB-886]|nr:glycosyltransferase [Phormidium tenue FACHB-886]
MPRVSVIVPTYNGDRFVAKAVESVLHQSYSDYELIVVDDGSSDGTAQVLASYAERIHYVSQANHGVAAARNHGLALAQGEFIAFLDQDDVLLPNKLALQVSCFEQHPDAGIVHSGWQIVNAQGTKLADIEPWQDVPVLDAVGWIKRMPVLFSAMMFRRRWVAQVGGLNVQFKQACDVDLVQRLVLAGCHSVWLPQVTVLYRQHDRNDSLNTIVQAEECWAVREQFFARSDIPEAIRRVERESRYHTLVWIAWRLYHTNQLPEMAAYLEKAVQYNPGTWTEAIVQWLDRFKDYETEYGCQFDMEKLMQSPDWQRLLQQLSQAIH